jgi:hypothetical protein
MSPDYYKNVYLQFRCKLNEAFEEFIRKDFELEDTHGHLYRPYFIRDEKEDVDNDLQLLRKTCERIRHYGGEFKLDFDQARNIILKEWKEKNSLKNIMKEIDRDCIFVDNDVIFKIRIVREGGYLMSFKDIDDNYCCEKIPENRVIDLKEAPDQNYIGKNCKLYLIEHKKVILYE